MDGATVTREPMSEAKIEQLLIDSLKHLQTLQESLHNVRNTIPSILAPFHAEGVEIDHQIGAVGRPEKKEPTPRSLAAGLRKAAASAISDVNSLQERWKSPATQAIFDDAHRREKARTEEGRGREAGSLPWLSDVYDTGSWGQTPNALGRSLDQRTETLGQLSIEDNHPDKNLLNSNYDVKKVEAELHDWKSKQAGVDAEVVSGSNTVKYDMKWLGFQPVLFPEDGHWLLRGDPEATNGYAGEVVTTVNSQQISSLTDLLDMLLAYQELSSAVCSLCHRKLSRSGKLAERRRKIKDKDGGEEWEAVHNECL